MRSLMKILEEYDDAVREENYLLKMEVERLRKENDELREQSLRYARENVGNLLRATIAGCIGNKPE